MFAADAEYGPKQVDVMRAAVAMLTEEHQKITATLMAFLSRVAARSTVNKMVAANLGMVCMCFESKTIWGEEGCVCSPKSTRRSPPR